MSTQNTIDHLISLVTVTDKGARLEVSSGNGQTMWPQSEAEKIAEKLHKETGNAVYLIQEGSRQIKNLTTGEYGILVKHCKKTVKVCCAHPTIKGAHVYKFWSNIEG